MGKKIGKIVVPTEPTNPPAKITGFTFKSYDKNAGFLQFQIKNQDGSPTDLIDATVRLFMYLYQGEEKKEYPVFDNQIITESFMQGIVKYPIPDMLLAYEGKVDAHVYIDFPDGSHTDNLAFTFTIAKSVIDGDVQLNGEYYFKDFQQLLDGVKQEATDAVNAALKGLDETIMEASDKVDQMVTDATTKVNDSIKTINSELETTKTTISKVAQQATDIEGKIAEADQHFVSKESVEKGPLIFKNTSITTEDWNDIKESGLYYCAASTGINAPYTGKLYGILTVYNDLAVIIQKYEFQGAMYIRTFAGNPAAWSSWIKMATANEVVNLTEHQVIGGIKDFSETPTVNGIEVATVQEDTGWVDLTANTGYSWGNPAQVRKIGKHVMWRGSLTGTTTLGDITSLPAGFEPGGGYEMQFDLPCQSQDAAKTARIYVRTNGTVGLIASTSSTSNIFLSGISYFVE